MNNVQIKKKRPVIVSWGLFFLERIKGLLHCFHIFWHIAFNNLTIQQLMFVNSGPNGQWSMLNVQ
jgi:hypothetical protein